MSNRTITIVSKDRDSVYNCSALQIVKRTIIDLSDYESPENYMTEIVNENKEVVARYPLKQCNKIMNEIIAMLGDITKDHIIYTLPEIERITEPSLWELRNKSKKDNSGGWIG